tara:strand:+ start:1510 stop:1716 length:207 start_codon:yes stop_codon:yes gene_type:complete
MSYTISHIHIVSVVNEKRPEIKTYPPYDELERIDKIKFIDDTIKSLQSERRSIALDLDGILGHIPDTD